MFRIIVSSVVGQYDGCGGLANDAGVLLYHAPTLGPSTSSDVASDLLLPPFAGTGNDAE